MSIIVSVTIKGWVRIAINPLNSSHLQMDCRLHIWRPLKICFGVATEIARICANLRQTGAATPRFAVSGST